MESYSKLFKKQGEVVLKSYNPDEEKYFEVIKSAREDGFRQVIVNSDIMIKILYFILESGGCILKINMSDVTDDDIKENIASITSTLKGNKLLFSKLKSNLEWAEEDSSIDIESIEVWVFKDKFKIYSNGVIEERRFNEPFRDHLKSIVEDYLYGKL